MLSVISFVPTLVLQEWKAIVKIPRRSLIINSSLKRLLIDGRAHGTFTVHSSKLFRIIFFFFLLIQAMLIQ